MRHSLIIVTKLSISQVVYLADAYLTSLGLVHP